MTTKTGRQVKRVIECNKDGRETKLTILWALASVLTTYGKNSEGLSLPNTKSIVQCKWSFTITIYYHA